MRLHWLAALAFPAEVERFASGMSADLKSLLEVPMAYLFLGLNEEAWSELDALPSAYQVEGPVYALRIEILQKLEKWEPARVIAESLAGSFPEDAGWWLA